MNILFLGTGAADRISIEQEKDFNQKNKRRCSAAILNGHILLDCGPHIINALATSEIEISNSENFIEFCGSNIIFSILNFGFSFRQ